MNSKDEKLQTLWDTIIVSTWYNLILDLHGAYFYRSPFIRDNTTWTTFIDDHKEKKRKTQIAMFYKCTELD